MKKTVFLSLILGITLILGISSDITLEEILKTNYTSTGGLDKIKGIKTIYIKGNVIIPMQNLEIPMEMWYKKPNKVRMESEFQGMKILQVYDGKIAWGIVPFAGIMEPQELPEDQAEEIIEQAEGMNPLVDFKEKGHKVEYIGKEDMEGTDVYKLKFTHKNGKITYFFLDTESCIELKTLTDIKKKDKEYRTETYYGDYKEFDGLMFPTSLQTHINGQANVTITFEEIKTNIAVEDSLFVMPKKDK